MMKKPDDLSDVCRLCLQPSKQLTHIFEDRVPYQPDEISLSSKIMACVSVKILPTDRGPRKICNKCMNNIDSWYQFNEHCKVVDAYLQNYLSEVPVTEQNALPKVTEQNGTPSKLDEMANVLCENRPLSKIAEQNGTKSKVDDITNVVCENSLLGEFSLSSFDSVFNTSSNFKSTSSSIALLDTFFDDETPEPKCKTGKISDTSNAKVVDTSAQDGIQTAEPEDKDPYLLDTELFSDAEQPPAKRRKGYNCELCNDTFGRFTNLLNHDETVHENIFRRHSCLTCGRLFISENRLKIHELSHRTKSHKCKTCNKLFSSAKSLQVHSRLHTGKYKCTTCGYVSTSKLYLEEHLLKHMGNETVYVCKVCSASFKRRSSLLRHENIHLRHGGKVYRCSICGIVTARRCELQEHMALHNKESAIEYKCNVCSKSYKHKKVLRVHLLRHREGTFVCKTCNKKLYSKYELREHEETHTHVKQFTCFHCNKKFSFRSTLLKHLKSNVPRVRSDIAVI